MFNAVELASQRSSAEIKLIHVLLTTNLSAAQLPHTRITMLHTSHDSSACPGVEIDHIVCDTLPVTTDRIYRYVHTRL